MGVLIPFARQPFIYLPSGPHNPPSPFLIPRRAFQVTTNQQFVHSKISAMLTQVGEREESEQASERERELITWRYMTRRWRLLLVCVRERGREREPVLTEVVSTTVQYRGTSLMRQRLPLGPYSSPMPRALWWS